MSEPSPIQADESRVFFIDADGVRLRHDERWLRPAGRSLIRSVAPNALGDAFFERPLDKRVVSLSARRILAAAGSPHEPLEVYSIFSLKPSILISDPVFDARTAGRSAMGSVDYIETLAFRVEEAKETRLRAYAHILQLLDREIDDWVTRLGEASSQGPQRFMSIDRAADGRPVRLSVLTIEAPITRDIQRSAALQKRLKARSEGDGMRNVSEWILTRPEMTALRIHAVTEFRTACERYRERNPGRSVGAAPGGR